MFLFFFKQKTAYEMRISDWSSDVCSSDLAGNAEAGVEALKIEVDGDLIIREHGAAVILQRFARRVAPYFRCGLRQLLFQIRGTPERDFSRVPRLNGIELRKVGGESRAVAGGRLLLHKTDGRVGRLQMIRSEEHTSELQSLMRTSYAVFCLTKKR